MVLRECTRDVLSGVVGRVEPHLRVFHIFHQFVCCNKDIGVGQHLFKKYTLM